mmetsp:Transcript_11064/g.34337  ORF Transcript_11064/g.34337 Transcript_11064/m.34337 type:complete len:221 (+) Transcript_11064:1535-2197(+)
MPRTPTCSSTKSTRATARRSGGSSIRPPACASGALRSHSTSSQKTRGSTRRCRGWARRRANWCRATCRSRRWAKACGIASAKAPGSTSTLAARGGCATPTTCRSTTTTARPIQRCAPSTTTPSTSASARSATSSTRNSSPCSSSSRSLWRCSRKRPTSCPTAPLPWLTPRSPRVRRSSPRSRRRSPSARPRQKKCQSGWRPSTTCACTTATRRATSCTPR